MSKRSMSPEATRVRLARRRAALGHSHSKDWNDKNPDKRGAQKAVELALLRGDLIRLPCERCGSDRVHAHHDDYSKPLEVMWLCPSHHKERHRELVASTEGEAA